MSDKQSATVSKTNAGEFKNDTLHVVVTRLPGLVVNLDIAVTPEAAAKYYEQALKNVKKEVTLPGFRKGKAPDQVVVSKYQKQIMAEWRQVVLQSAYTGAIALTKLHPFKQNIQCKEFKELSKEKGAKIVLEYEVSPTVPHINLEALHLVPEAPISVTDKDTDKVLRNIQLYRAKWEEITDRPVKEGDFVDLDIDSLDEPQRSLCKHTRFEAAKGVMADWMHKLVIGLKVHESAEGVSAKEKRGPSIHDDEDEDDQDKEAIAPDFRPTHCRLTVQSIKKPTLPELNDEFAKSTGVKDIEELRSRIHTDLVRRANEKVRIQLCRQAESKLLEKYHFEVPKSILDEETEHRLNMQKQWFEQNDFTKEDMEKEMKLIEQRIPRDVERMYRLMFLLLQFSQEHNLNVTQEELIQELSQRLASGQMEESYRSNPEAVQKKTAQSLLMRKAINYIAQHAGQKEDKASVSAST